MHAQYFSSHASHGKKSMGAATNNTENNTDSQLVIVMIFSIVTVYS